MLGREELVLQKLIIAHLLKIFFIFEFFVG